MKKFLALVVILLIVVLGGPFFGSYKAKSELDKMVQYINLQPGYKAEWDYYDRGWLQSEGRLLLSIVGFEALLEEPSDALIPIELNVNHGPVLIKDGFRPGWFSGNATFSLDQGSGVTEWVKLEREGPFWRSDFVMSLAGTLTTEDSLQAFSLDLGDERVEAAAYSGSGQLTYSGHITYQGMMPSVSFTGNDTQVAMEVLRINTDIEAGELLLTHNFAPGTANFTVDKMVGDGPDINSFTLSDLNFSNTNALSDDGTLADIDLAVTFDTLSLEENQIEDFHFDMEFARISLEFLRQYSEGMQKLNDPNTAPQEATFDVFGLVSEHLIPAGPEIKINDLSFESEKGDLEFSGNVSVPPQAPGTQVNPFTVFQLITMDAAVNAEKSLVMEIIESSARDTVMAAAVESETSMTEEEIDQAAKEQAAMQYDMLVMQGMLIEKDGFVSSELEFKQGVATVNGQPMPMPF